MVNGAGLAMATMDIIKLKGGEPANFLDVGGGANVEQVKTAFEILSSHPKVKTILINIFGGIMKCDTIATGIIKAAELVNLRIPLVCRLTGTNADKGNQMLKEFTEKNTTLQIEVASDLDDAAVKAVRTASLQKWSDRYIHFHTKDLNKYAYLNMIVRCGFALKYNCNSWAKTILWLSITDQATAKQVSQEKKRQEASSPLS